MKNILISILLVVLSGTVYAKDIPCHGKIIFLMGDHPGCTDANGVRQYAFVTGETSNAWMCAKTQLGSSMLLAAKAADKSIQVYISDKDQGLTCSTLTNYSKISYIVMNN